MKALAFILCSPLMLAVGLAYLVGLVGGAIFGGAHAGWDSARFRLYSKLRIDE